MAWVSRAHPYHHHQRAIFCSFEGRMTSRSENSLPILTTALEALREKPSVSIAAAAGVLGAVVLLSVTKQRKVSAFQAGRRAGYPPVCRRPNFGAPPPSLKIWNKLASIMLTTPFQPIPRPSLHMLGSRSNLNCCLCLLGTF